MATEFGSNLSPNEMHHQPLRITEADIASAGVRGDSEQAVEGEVVDGGSAIEDLAIQVILE
jgi:hypothetical protein